MPSSKTTVISVRLPNEDYKLLMDKAQKRGKTPSDWLRPIIHTAVHPFKPKNVE
jgi:predicted DNA-binding protein